MKASTAQVLNSMQFSIIMIDMNSGAHDAYCFEVKTMQNLVHIRCIAVFGPRQERKQSMFDCDLRSILHVNPNIIVSTVMKNTSTNYKIVCDKLD